MINLLHVLVVCRHSPYDFVIMYELQLVFHMHKVHEVRKLFFGSSSAYCFLAIYICKLTMMYNGVNKKIDNVCNQLEISQFSITQFVL